MVYPALIPLMRTTRLPVVDGTDAPADFNGPVRFAERRNLVSARVPSHSNWPLPIRTTFLCRQSKGKKQCPKGLLLSRIRHRQWDIDPDDGGTAVIETAVLNYVDAAGRLTGSQGLFVVKASNLHLHCLITY